MPSNLVEGDNTPGALNTYTEVEGVFLVEAFLAIRSIHTWSFQYEENKLMLIKRQFAWSIPLILFGFIDFN